MTDKSLLVSVRLFIFEGRQGSEKNFMESTIMNVEKVIASFAPILGASFAVLTLYMKNKKSKDDTAFNILKETVDDLQITVEKLEQKVEKLEKEKEEKNDLILELREQNTFLKSENKELTKRLKLKKGGKSIG